MADKKMNTVELTDEELKSIQGGYNYYQNGDKYYEYVGSDENQKYVCPICGRPVHAGAWWRFYCDPCDKSWFREASLDINLASGAWASISKEEYRRKSEIWQLHPRLDM